MAKKLVIVESPAKAGTIKKILGNDYDVVASVGHIRDLPKTKLGVDVENNFEPSYITIKGKKEVIDNLKEHAKKAEKIFLASDPDREGEAIAWHIAQALKLKKDVNRVEFNEITKQAIKDAVKKPREIDMNRVDAQQARRILDRLVGYKISPLLWKTIDVNTSAGRVQSVALKLICDLEDEIKRFVPESYWEIAGMFLPLKNKKESIELKLHKYGEEKGDRVKDKASADKIKLTEGKEYSITKTKTSHKSKKPPLPLKTSTLQQLAASYLGFSATRTMKIAQTLYEGVNLNGNHMGLITYMRTDSVRISDEAKQATQKYISHIYGEKYVGNYIPPQSKGKVQDAHEAIRPTDIVITPESVKDIVTAEQYKLYKIIWERFLISQFANLEYEQMEIIAGYDIYQFRGIINKVVFDGYYKVLKEEDEEVMTTDFPDLLEGEKMLLSNLKIKEGETKPPARFSEASLVKKLEAEGIGRPSTYAAIIETLKKREYVKVEARIFYPTELGYEVKNQLEKYFPNIMNIKFTAQMELNLDEVEEGNKNWIDVLSAFYDDLKKFLAPLEETADKLQNMRISTDILCSKCGLNMVLKTGRFGKYVECEKEECKEKVSLPKGIIISDEELTTQNVILADKIEKAMKEKEGIETDALCEKCGGKLKIKTGRFGKYFECDNYEECKNRFSIPKELKLTPDILSQMFVEVAAKLNIIVEENKRVLAEHGTCDKCGGIMAVKTGRFGKFLACTNYPDCKNIKKYPRKPKSDENSEEGSKKTSKAKTKKAKK